MATITEWILEINGKGVAVTSDSPTVLIKKTKSFVSSFSGDLNPRLIEAI